MKTINNELIRSFKPCYDPSEKGIPDDEALTVHEWVAKYRNIISVSDILWLLLRNEFYDNRQLRLFAVWCAREALKLVENSDQRSINACNVAEKFANGDATKEDLDAVYTAANDAARAAASGAARAAARAASGAAKNAAWAASVAAWAASVAAIDAAIDAARDAAKEKQLNYLLTL